MSIRKIKYKAKERINDREIVRYLHSLGSHHYYLVRHIPCGKVSVMHQGVLDSIKRNKLSSIGCRFCNRQENKKKKSLTVVPLYLRTREKK